MKYRILLTLIIGMFLLSFTNAITITPISPLTNITTQNSSINIQYNMSCNTGLNCTTNYTFNGNSFVFDPILFYNMDNRSSLGENDTYIKDLSGYGNDGTVIGDVNVSMTPSGKYNGGVEFSGDVGYVNIPATNNLLNVTTAFTINYWLYIHNNSGISRIINKGDVNSGSNLQGWEFDASATNINFYVNNQSGTTNLNSTSTSYTKDTWYMITGLYNGTDMQLYKNGVLINTKHLNFNSFINNNIIYIGRRNSALSQFLNGSVDDLLLFNRSLTASEITQLYNFQLTKRDNQNSTLIINNNLINTTNLNSTSQSIVYPYSLCIINSSLSQVCNNQQVTRTLKGSQLIYSSIILNTVNPFFIGTNTHGIWGSNLSFVDTGGVRYASNYTWQRQMLDSVFMKSMRADIAINEVSINETTFNYTFTGSNYKNINTRINIVTWAKQTGKKITFIADKVPDWNKNVTSGCITDNLTCFPNNFTMYGNTIANFLVAVGCDASVCDIEVYNEPYDKLLGNELRNSPNISIGYNSLYNATYIAVKAKFPTMKVGSNILHFGYNNANNTNYNYTDFISKFPNQFDFISAHMYWNDGIYAQMQGQLGTVKSVCSTYGANCNDIRIGELNTINASLQNNTLNWNHDASILASAFLFALTNNFTSIQLYQWMDSTNYLNNSEYPNQYNSVSEPQLDNAIYPPYNITYLFTRYAGAGKNVLVSTINDSTDGAISSSPIQGVATDSGGGSFIITNTDTEARNMTAVIPSGTYIKVSDGTLYTSDGVNPIQLGIFNSYGMESYTLPVPRQTNGVGYFDNYLGEEIREMTDAEHDAYFPDSLGCDSNYFAGSNLIMILSALALISVVLFFTFKDGLTGVNVGSLILLFVVIVVCIALFVGSAQNLGSYCNG